MSQPETTDLLGEGDPADVVGHKTMADGTHLPLRRDEAAAMLAEADRRQTERERTMPTEGDAIEALFDAWLRLKELGWREAIYCPKDGSWFDAVECGSTGIHRCHYSGQWPDGAWWVEDGGDLWPAHPTLFRLDPEAEAERKRRMAEAAAKYRAENDFSDHAEGVADHG